jgi:hypothetical protein
VPSQTSSSARFPRLSASAGAAPVGLSADLAGRNSRKQQITAYRWIWRCWAKKAWCRYIGNTADCPAPIRRQTIRYRTRASFVSILFALAVASPSGTPHAAAYWDSKYGVGPAEMRGDPRMTRVRQAAHRIPLQGIPACTRRTLRVGSL